MLRALEFGERERPGDPGIRIRGRRNRAGAVRKDQHRRLASVVDDRIRRNGPRRRGPIGGRRTFGPCCPAHRQDGPETQDPRATSCAHASAGAGNAREPLYRGTESAQHGGWLHGRVTADGDHGLRPDQDHFGVRRQVVGHAHGGRADAVVHHHDVGIVGLEGASQVRGGRRLAHDVIALALKYEAKQAVPAVRPLGHHDLHATILHACSVPRTSCSNERSLPQFIASVAQAAAYTAISKRCSASPQGGTERRG